MGRYFAQDHSCPNQQPVRSLFVCKHKQVQPFNTNALVRAGPKPPAGTLQADGSWIEETAPSPQKGSSVHGHWVQ